MVAKNQKIYTKHLNMAVVDAFGSAVEHNAGDYWLVQDDIEIVAAELCISGTRTVTGVGHYAVHADLSQVGILVQDGMILEALASGFCSSTAELGHPAQANVQLAFPAGFRIPVKEEGYIYLNMIDFLANVSAGNVAVCVHGVVYYIKV